MSGILHAWFKPTMRLMLDGGDWITDGKLALKWPAHEALPYIPNADSILGAYIANATVEGVSERVRGWAVFGTEGYAGHFIDLIEAAHPGAKWRRKPGGDFNHAVVAYLDGRPVGIVMAVRDYASQPANEGPECPACDGSGGEGECEVCEGQGTRPCPECDGEGETTCPHCDQDMECEKCDGEGNLGDCKDCKGKGHLGDCKECGGSGVWRAEQGIAGGGAS